MKGKCVLLFMRACACLPLRVNRFMGAQLGRLIFMLNNRDVKVTKENLKRCFPEKSEVERDSIAQKSLIETGKLAFEIPWTWYAKRTKIMEHIIDIKGDDLVKQALEKGKGVIVLSPHLGNWEVLGRVLSGFGQITCLYQPPKQDYLEPVLRRSRLQDGNQLVPTTARGVAKLLSALKKGAMTGILPDQCPDSANGGGELSEFFSHPAQTVTLIHGLIQRTDCVVLMGYAERVKNGFVVHFSMADDGIYDENVNTSLRAMNTSIETCVLQTLMQYQWEYKRFKGLNIEDKPYRF